MLCPEMVEFAPGALAQVDGHYTGEIQFSGKSARMARRLSRRATMEQVRVTILSFLYSHNAVKNYLQCHDWANTALGSRVVTQKGLGECM